MRSQIPLILQITGLMLFSVGTITPKSSNILRFLEACFTGLV